MTDMDRVNQNIPEEVAFYAKEIFDNLTLNRQNPVPAKDYMSR